jgi:hypothetical protein
VVIAITAQLAGDWARRYMAAHDYWGALADRSDIESALRAAYVAGASAGPGRGYDDIEAQLQCAMGDDVHPGWAPAIIEIVRHRHPQLWESAVLAAANMDTQRKEL